MDEKIKAYLDEMRKTWKAPKFNFPKHLAEVEAEVEKARAEAEKHEEKPEEKVEETTEG